MLTAEQMRAARAMLRMEQTELAKRAAVSVETIKRLEGGVGKLKAQHETLKNIQIALEFAGIEFLDDMERPGVQLAADTAKAFVEAMTKEISGLTHGILTAELMKDPAILNRGKKELIKFVVNSLIPLLKHTLPNRLPGR